MVSVSYDSMRVDEERTIICRQERKYKLMFFADIESADSSNISKSEGMTQRGS